MQDYQEEQVTLMKTWTDSDATMAMYEGWCITNTSQGNTAIARFDEACVFKDDFEAARFVMHQFLNGSGLAAKAIYYLIAAHYEVPDEH